MTRELADVLIVGAGPAGLAAAIELRRLGAGRVVVAEREQQAGGIPRHSDHLGFGMRDLHRVLSGPAYARRYVDAAIAAGVDVRIGASVTGWAGDRTLSITGPAAITELEATAVVLATGCRERPRSARLVPGDRPAGIFTTGSLQQLVHLHGHHVGRRAVVVGAEHVSFSAVMTLRHAGTDVLALVTEHERHETYGLLAFASAGIHRIPVLTNRRVARIIGRDRVEALEIVDIRDGSTTRVACDTVVFTGGWIPELELAALGGLAMNPGTKGPSVDAALRCSVPGVFASGNVLHGAETSDVAAGEGRRVASSVVEWLASSRWLEGSEVRVIATDPISWVTPDVLPVPTRGASSGGHLTLRVGRFVERSRVEVRQAGQPLWTGKPMGRLVPGRSFHVSTSWRPRVRDGAGPVTVRLLDA
jgi:thioredoxin reductase